MKYKINYLTAGKPKVNDLKNINIFEKNTIAHDLLDPINGFFFLESNALNNFYKYGDDNYPISMIARSVKIFKELDNKVIPSNDFKDMDSFRMGQFLGIQFYNIFILPVIKEYYTQEIKDLNYIKSEITKLLNDTKDQKNEFIKKSNEIDFKSDKISLQYEDGSKFLAGYQNFIIRYLEGLNKITSTQTTDVQTNIKNYREFVKDTRQEINAIMSIFNEKKI